ASRLHRQGWLVQPTISGYRFTPPDGCRDFEEVRERLAQLGIDEPFTDITGRTLEEVDRVYQAFADRVWYAHQLAALADRDGDRPRDPDAARPAPAFMRALEQRYGETLRMADERELAWAEGVLAALAWVMGDPLDVPVFEGPSTEATG